MKRRHIVALLLLIVAPLVLIGWLGTSALARQQQQQTERLQSFFQERLARIDDDLLRIADDYESKLFAKLQSANRDISSLRQIRAEEPSVRSVVLVDRDGRLVYPSKPTTDDPARLLWHAALSELARGRPISGTSEFDPEDRVLTRESASNSSSTRNASRADPSRSGSSSARPAAASATGGASSLPASPRWQTWFHEGGIQLVLWLPRSDRTATGVILERGRWMADLITALPDVSNGPGTYQLRDGAGRSVYQWGDSSINTLSSTRGEATDTITPFASIRLSSPWNAWQLTYDDASLQSPISVIRTSLPLIATLLAIAISLALLGSYVMTSLRRQMRLASQRVSFASHVSHELRTPLTNIRLYAELAKRDLRQSGDDTAKASSSEPDPATLHTIRRLDVIEEESRRLSRIVTGVLDMVSGKGRLSPRQRVPDEVIGQAVEGFIPAFDQLELTVNMNLSATQPVMLDEDVIEIVMVNLLSNVEKYASQGKSLQLTTNQDESSITIDMIDDGPGIARSDAKRIFEPFERLDDSLSAPAGTGLGLAIARNAARRHGGDLVLLPTSAEIAQSGTHFRFVFRPADVILSHSRHTGGTQS
ncbi:MAG: ATP-binding protein [Planctomycetota bacterium]